MKDEMKNMKQVSHNSQQPSSPYLLNILHKTSEITYTRLILKGNDQ